MGIGTLLNRKKTTAYYWRLRQKAITTGFRPLRMYYRLRHQRYLERFGGGIGLDTVFAGVPVFPHGFQGVFISEGATIGKNCVIFHQVTIGSNTLPGSPGRGFPVVGDNVYIGCGAKIIGNVHIGNNVRIGANCVVTRDVPDNATVILQSPRVLVRTQKQDNRFIRYDEMMSETI